ncbi:DinB family protein [Pedobacter sp. PAMC26386]|nr:DinB family protein [Pedobacter sp. PAMC26386]
METILLDTDQTFTNLLQIVSAFDDKQLNEIPFKGSWTAGQVLQHLILANSGFIEVMQGPVKETERKPDQQVALIRKDFLNFDSKMESPDFILPLPISYSKQRQIGTLENIKSGLLHLVDTAELDKTCLAFELPGYGFLTRFEAVYFVNYHTQRHSHQLKNIYQYL